MEQRSPEMHWENEHLRIIVTIDARALHLDKRRDMEAEIGMRLWQKAMKVYTKHLHAQFEELDRCE